MNAESLTDGLRETLALFDGSGTPRTTSEVAAQLDLGRRSTYDRLDRLVDHGRLETKKVGASARVWWRPRASSPDVRSTTPPDWPATAESLIDDVLFRAEVGVFVLDADLDVVWVNDATERYFGIDRERVVGRNKRGLVEETIASKMEESTTFAETVLATYDDNTYTEQFECHVTPGEEREERWLEHRSKPIDSGSYAGGRVELYYDVTGRKRAERAHRSESDKLESLVAAVEEYAMFMLGPEGYVETWNPGAERIKGYGEEEILGEHVSTFYTSEDVDDRVPQQNLETAADRGMMEDEGWRVRKDGTRYWADVTITAIRDEGGDLRGFAEVTRDSTERREHEREIRRERDLLEQILETSPIGISVFNPDGSIDRANTQTADHLELSADEVEEYTLSDRDVLDPSGDELSLEERPVGRVIETGEPVVDQEIRMEDPNGGARWFSTNATPITDDDGEIERIVFTATDVTELEEQARRLERQRDELEAELQEHFERVDDAFYALDDEMRFTYVNDRAEELLGHPEVDLLGRNIWEALSVSTDDLLHERYEMAMATQEPTSFERYSDRLGIWEIVRVYPSESGLSVYFADITDLKERERALEESERRYRTLVDNFPNGAVVLFDEDLRYLIVGGEAYDGMGVSSEELEGERVPERVPDEIREAIEPRYRAVFDGEASRFELEFNEQVRQFRVLPVYDESGTVFAGMAMSQDVTDRVERQRELEEYRRWNRTLVENFPAGAVGLVDRDFRYVTFAGSPEGGTNVTREDLEGADVRDVLPEHIADVVVPGYEAALDGVASEFEDSIGGRVYQFHFAPVRDDDGEVFAATGMSQDVTDRKEREAELRNRIRQQEVVTDLGQRALADRDLDVLLAEAAELVAETLDNQYCKVLDLDAEAEELLLRQGVGWDDGVVGSATVSSVEADSQAAYTLASRQPVRVEDLGTETRFGGPDLLTDHDVRSGISTIIGSPDDPWGILGTHHTETKRFTDHDVNFVRSVANILAGAIERHEYEGELVRHGEQLAGLNSLNEVFQDISDAVIERSTRQEIEAAVCEGLAAADSFSSAWIGDVDPVTQTLDVRIDAGVDGYVDGLTVSVDPADERSQGPGGQAFLTREVQVARDVQSDRNFEPWRAKAESYGIRSAAAVPIVYDDRIYGVLAVYAERPEAFAEAERRVLGQLGEVVGHAIAAVERKRALMSDEVVELEFYLEDAFAAAGIDASFGGRLALDQSVPVGDEEYLVYGTATEEAWPALDELVDALPHWKEFSELGTWGGTRRFELILSEPPVLSVVASRGGYVDTARIEDGDYYMVIHLPPAGDIRAVTRAVTDAYPTAEFLAQRQLSRAGESAAMLERLVHEELTDCQRAALEAAFYAGFFEWPREVTGEGVAESLDVSQPTFHQHLRKAERKVFGSLLSTRDPA